MDGLVQTGDLTMEVLARCGPIHIDDFARITDAVIFLLILAFRSFERLFLKCVVD